MSDIARKSMAGLKPLDPGLSAEVLEWVGQLRVIWAATGLSLNQFACLHGPVDKGTISRYLNGQRVPRDRWFLDKLLAIQADNGQPVISSVREHMTRLHLRALETAHPHEYRVRLVSDELEIALTGKLEAERYACALEDQLAKRNRQILELAGNKGRLQAAVEHPPPALASPVRTLILGVDYHGRIVQHDRNAQQILAREHAELLGAQLSDLTADSAQANSHGVQGHQGALSSRSADGAAAVSGLLEAIRSGREGSTMLTIDTGDGYPAEAVVTVHPMCAGGTSLAALVQLHIPAREERFVDPALMRRQMLNDTFTRTGDSLDIDHRGRELMAALVPHFCNAGGLVLVESLADTTEPAPGPEGPLRRIAVLHDRKDPAWETAFPTGEIFRYPERSAYYRCLETSLPVLETAISKGQASAIARAWRRKPVAKLLSDTSMVLLPLIARGTMLGFFVCARQEGFRRFDDYDVEIGMDFASRAAVSIDGRRSKRCSIVRYNDWPSSRSSRARCLQGSR